MAPWTAKCQASLSFTISQSLLKLMSIELVTPSNHLILCLPLLLLAQSFPASGSFPMSQLFASGGQSIGASASASVLPVNILGLISFRIDWFDLCAYWERERDKEKERETLLESQKGNAFRPHKGPYPITSQSAFFLSFFFSSRLCFSLLSGWIVEGVQDNFLRVSCYSFSKQS